MKKLLELGNRYAAESTWKDFALTKFCLFSMGLGIGVLLHEKHKKAALILSSVVFAVTYVFLMMKLFRIAFRKTGK